MFFDDILNKTAKVLDVNYLQNINFVLTKPT
jgi:hypothetical protein